MLIRTRDGIVIEWNAEMRRWLPTDVRSRTAALKANAVRRKHQHLEEAEQYRMVLKELGGKPIRSR